MLLMATLASCSDAPPANPVVSPAPKWTAEQILSAGILEEQLFELEPESGDLLRVDLAFTGEADLDLYVTGPLDETVYYANTPSRAGAELLEDLRCLHPAPRIETVLFPRAPGRYRVGVDYAHACGNTRTPVPFALRVEAPGYRQQIRGLAVHQVFEPVVLEFKLDSEVNP